MDKEKQQIDTKFIDHSWNNMSVLLDKEMPVQKRKRRFIWLWFLGFVAIMIFAFTFYHYHAPKQNITPKTTTLKVDKIAQKDAPSKNEILISKHKTTLPSKNKTSQIQLNKKSINSNKKLESSIASTSEIATNRLPNKKESKKQNSFQPSIEIEKVIESAEENFPSSLLTTKVAPNYQRWLSHNISKMPLLTFPLFNKEQSIKIIPIVNPINQKSSKWRFGLYAGALTNNLGSFRAGIHSNLIINPKWRLHIGLGYANKNRNNGSINNGTESADIMLADDNLPSTELENTNSPNSPTGNPINGPSGTAASGAGLAPSEVDLMMNLNYTKFHYFELPILFQYQINPKWSLDFGGQIALFHGVNYEQQGESTFTTQPGAFANTTTRTQQTNLGTINKLNFAAIGGISYQILPKLSAYSNYHYSGKYITNSLTSSDMEKRWQQIEVGVRYYFK